jgi:hypothetical protein
MVVRGELPELHQQGAALDRGRGMSAARRVAQIATGRIVAALVTEHPVEHEDLLAATMHMLGKMTAGGKAHQAGGARHLVADAVQRDARHTLLWRVLPGQGGGVQHHTLFEVGIQLHRNLGLTDGQRPHASRTAAELPSYVHCAWPATTTWLPRGMAITSPCAS